MTERAGTLSTAGGSPPYMDLAETFTRTISYRAAVLFFYFGSSSCYEPYMANVDGGFSQYLGLARCCWTLKADNICKTMTAQSRLQNYIQIFNNKLIPHEECSPSQFFLKRLQNIFNNIVKKKQNNFSSNSNLGNRKILEFHYEILFLLTLCLIFKFQ